MGRELSDNAGVRNGRWPYEGKNQRGFENQDNGIQYKKEDAITFYFSNIHQEVTDGELWMECMNLGHLVDAYIARKKDKWGNRFGFVRFVNVKDGERMIKALNQLIFYGWRIRAKVARFVKITKKPDNMRQGSWIRKEEPKPETRNVRVDESRPRNGGGMSYADTVRGKKVIGEEDNTLKFTNESEAFKEWCNKAIICEFNSIKHLKRADVCAMELRLEKGVIRYLGGLKVLITFNEAKDMESFMKYKEELMKEWFQKVEIWRGQLYSYQRVAWIMIRGVPIWLWSKEVMEIIASKIGKVVQGSDADKYDVNLQLDVVGVIVDHGLCIKETLPVVWKDQSFKVWISEIEEPWIRGCIINRGSNYRIERKNTDENKHSEEMKENTKIQIGHRKKWRLIIL
ncbi:putative RNA recognition motif domain, nucleotide-binding alpha-beta plait domain superfamily [Helianthus anomalus]